MTHSPAASGTTGWERTHYCGEIGTGDVGKEVILFGWAMHWRDFGGLVFVDLRDRTGIAQVVFNPQVAPEAHTRAREIRSEYLLGIRGTVQRRPENAINPELPTGEVEIAVEELRIVNTAKTLPFQIEEEKGEVSETLRLKYRYL
ncbi:MAG: aspartate--tRNA ligase, partial [Deltaproteobacteria bacterium]